MATPSLGADLTVDAIAKDALEKMIIKQEYEYANYFNAKIYGNKSKPIWFEGFEVKPKSHLELYNESKNEIKELLTIIEKLQAELASMIADRDYWHKIYGSFVEAIIEGRLTPNPNHPDNQPQPQFHIVISAINKIGKNPHASRYSVIENGEIN